MKLLLVYTATLLIQQVAEARQVTDVRGFVSKMDRIRARAMLALPGATNKLSPDALELLKTPRNFNVMVGRNLLDLLDLPVRGAVIPREVFLHLEESRSVVEEFHGQSGLEEFNRAVAKQEELMKDRAYVDRFYGPRYVTAEHLRQILDF